MNDNRHKIEVVPLKVGVYPLSTLYIWRARLQVAVGENSIISLSNPLTPSKDYSSSIYRPSSKLSTSGFKYITSFAFNAPNA